MHTMTYKDIIDEKTAEWQKSLKQLEGLAAKASAESRVAMEERIDRIRSAIDSATIELRQLDERETVGNTVETKDKILKIFSSIDRDLTAYQAKTPYML